MGRSTSQQAGYVKEIIIYAVRGRYRVQGDYAGCLNGWLINVLLTFPFFLRKRFLLQPYRGDEFVAP